MNILGTTRPYRAAGGIVILFLLITYGPVIFSPGSLLTSGDGMRFFYPGFLWLRSHIPFLPLWTEQLGGGYPLVAESQVAAYYPPLWLAALWPDPVQAYNCYQLGHLLLLFLFSLLFFKQLARSWCGALIGAAAFAFGGKVIGLLDHPNQPVTTTWLPLLFYFTLRYFREDRPFPLVCGGITTGIMMLAGHNQVSLLAYLGLVPFACYYAFTSLPGSRRRQARRFLTALAIPLVLGFIIAAVQVIPFLQLLAQSVRAGAVSGSDAGNTALAPWHLLMLLFPFAFGANGAFWLQARYLSEVSLYIGVIPLVAALATLWPGATPRRQRWFWWGFTALFLLLAMGDQTPLFSLLRRLPLFASLLIPARYALLSQFGLAALAAFGAANFFTQPRRTIFIAAAALGTALFVWLCFNYAPASVSTLLRHETLLTDIERPAHISSSLRGRDLGMVIVNAGSILIITWLAGRKQGAARGLLCIVLLFDLSLFGHRLLLPSTDSERYFQPAASSQARRIYHLHDVTDDDSPNYLLASNVEDFDIYTTLRLRQHEQFLRLLDTLDEKAVALARVDQFRIPEPATYNRVHFSPDYPLAMVSGITPWQLPLAMPWGDNGFLDIVLAFTATRSLEPGTAVGRLSARVTNAPFTAGNTVSFPLRVLVESGDLLEERYRAPRPGGELACRHKLLTDFYIRYYFCRFPLPAGRQLLGITISNDTHAGSIIVAGLRLWRAGVNGGRDFFYPQQLTLTDGNRGIPSGSALPAVLPLHAARHSEPLFQYDAFRRGRFAPAEAAVSAMPDIGPTCSSARVEVLHSGPERVTLTAAGEEAFPLLRLSAWYPEWGCMIDDAPVPVYLTNVMFQGIIVPPGNHTVTFIYLRQAFHIGLAVTVLGALASLFLFFRCKNTDL